MDGRATQDRWTGTGRRIRHAWSFRAGDHQPAGSRHPRRTSAAATRLLLESPDLSLGELATRIGTGRTTLHRMFPTREAVLAAVAHDAIEYLTVVYAEAGLGADDAEDPVGSLGRLVELLVPLGPRLMFLLRANELRDDTDLDRRIAALDAPLLRTVEDAQRRGALDRGLPVWWVTESLYAVVYVAREQVELGRLAARDARLDRQELTRPSARHCASPRVGRRCGAWPPPVTRWPGCSGRPRTTTSTRSTSGCAPAGRSTAAAPASTR